MSLVTYNVKDRVAFVTLNRAEKRNALNPELISELKVALDRAALDTSAKVIVLKANGEAFCAGADLAYLQQLQKFSYEENLADSQHLMELFLKIYTLPKVVVAQVQGHALAGGCGLASVCDFVFAAPEAKFGYTEVKIGFVPALVAVFLIRKLGEQRARQLLLTGELIKAEEAFARGLVTRVVPAELLNDHVVTFCTNLIESNSEQSMQLTKSLIAKVQDMSIEDALNYAASVNANARATEDCKRGIAAFLSKQDLKW